MAALTLSALAAVAQAEVRAVLVGVSDYADETGIADLKGPQNDVALMDRVLRERGVTEITILADGIDGAQRPTRAAILSAIAEVATASGPGDVVYLHLSGHGTQQADRDGDETDGLDEVFLPADTARAEAGSGVIPNALVDDELGRAINAIRAAGADVFFVMDSCHSGSGLRAASPSVVYRYVDPSSLGVSVGASGGAEDAVGLDETSGRKLPGGVMAFYAAQSSELAREVNLGAKDEPHGSAGWYGLFSAKLAARLEMGASSSYRQLFQAVLTDINDTRLPGAARLQTPTWEGTMIDAAVFGGAGSIGVRRFAVNGEDVEAGRVHGLSHGTLVGLVADAGADADDIIGRAQVEAPDATRAVLHPVATDCVPRAEALCPRHGELPAAARFAQVIAQPVDLVVRFNTPWQAATGEALPEATEPVRRLKAAVAELEGSGGQGVAIDPNDFDVDVVWDGSALWFGEAAMMGRTPAGLSYTPGQGPLAPLLVRIAKARTLSATLDALAEMGSILNPTPVEVSAELLAVPINALAATSEDMSPVRECRAALAQAGSPAALPRAADLKQCDRLSFAARASVSGAYDVNRIHIDAQSCVFVEYERIEDARAGRALGPAMVMCSDCPGGYSAGVERLFTVVTPAKPNAEPVNLGGIIDTCGGQGATRGHAKSAALDVLMKLARRPGTRGAFGGAEIDAVWVERWTWKVLPRTEAFRKGGRAIRKDGRT